MRRTIHLRFSVDVGDEGEAWDVAEALERAALARNYVGISAWVENPDGGRSGVLGPEGSEAPLSEAMRVERSTGEAPTAVGDAEGMLTVSVFGREEL